jgi:hypothetical protein
VDAEATGSGTKSPNTQNPTTIEQESTNILVSSTPDEPEVKPVAPEATVDDHIYLTEATVDVREAPSTNRSQESMQGEHLRGQTIARRPYETPEAFSGASSSRSDLELQKAVEEFQKNYRLFARSHKQYILIEGDLEAAFTIPQTDVEIRDTAKAFGNAIWTTIGAIERKDEIVGQKWPNKVGRFLVKLCPLTRLALQLTGTVADVLRNSLNLIIVGNQADAFERGSDRSRYYPPGNPPFILKSSSVAP